MIFMLNKKGISPVVATALLLVVAVVAVVGFQNWFGDFESQVLSSTEHKSSMSNSLKIQGVVGDELYLYSGGRSNLSTLKIVSDSGQEMCSFQDSGVEVSNNSLVGWWKLNDESATIKDYSGQGNDGKLYGNTRLLLNFDDGTADDRTSYSNNGVINGADCSGSGINGQGCRFDGVDDYVEIQNQTNLNFFNESFTISFWLKRNGNQSNYNGVLSSNILGSPYWIGPNSNFMIYFLQNDTLSFTQYSSSIYHDLNIVNIDKDWNNVMYIKNGNTLYAYLNGKLNSTLDITGLEFLASKLGVGKQDVRDDHYFNGSIDEFVIYSKALSSEEVKDLYNSQKAKFIEFKNSKLDKAVEFDGVDDYIRVKNSAILGNIDNLTICGISKTNNPNIHTQPIYVETYVPTGRTTNSLDFHGGKIIFDKYPPSGGWLSSNINPVSNIRYFVCTSQNSSTRSLYIDGNLDSKDNSVEIYTGPNPTESVIGAYDFTSGVYGFMGQIDEVRIYNRTLSQEEISKLYWDYISNNEKGINKIDLNGCNLEKGKKYNIIAFTDNQKAESYFIAK